MPPYDGRVSGRAVCPIRQGVASSETEMSCPLEGRFATLERGGNGLPARGQVRYPRARRRSFRGFEGGANGPHRVSGLSVGLLSFLPDWKEAVGLSGPSCLSMCLRFEAI